LLSLDYSDAGHIGLPHEQHSIIFEGKGDADGTLLDNLVAPEPRPSDIEIQELLDSSGVSPPCRAVLMLHFQEEMPLADVAAVLELPVGTVKSRLAYGLTALRRHFAVKKE